MKKTIVDIAPFGMCNQLFMYAYGRYVQIKRGEGELYLNYEKCTNADHGATWDNCLSKFELHYTKVLFSKKDLIYYGKLEYFIKLIVSHIKMRRNISLEYRKSGILLKKLGILMNSNLDTHKNDQYYEKLPITNTIWCMGYFQNPDIVKSIKKSLQSEIVLKAEFMPSDNHYCQLQSNIINNNSVAIHIRRGDYVNHSIMAVCTDEYYLKAVEEMKKRLSDPCFFVFSDDIEYAKKLFCVCQGSEFTFVSGQYKDYEELMLMTKCKHFIISNSSFSYWGQFLSVYKDKTVISPNRWSVDGIDNVMAEPDWILM